MRKRKKLFIALITAILLTAAFFILHTSPLIAVRTKLFFDGHPIAAVKTDIKYNEFQQNLDYYILKQEGSKIYSITTGAKDWQTGNYIFNYKVTRKGFLYFVHSYGEC